MFSGFAKTFKYTWMGRSEAVRREYKSMSTESLLGYSLVTGLLIGINRGVTQGGSLAETAYVIFATTISLPAVALFWSLLASVLARAGAKRRELHDVFLGSSIVMLPTAFPFLGFFVFGPLLLAWVFIAARLTAAVLSIKPGSALIYVAIPPFLAYFLLQLFLLILGMSRSA